jgi:hypothetical protein
MEDEKRGLGAAGTGPPEVDLACGTISPGINDQAVDRQVDPLLAVLLRAACLFDLVEAGVLTPLEAFDRLEQAVHMVAPCTCEAEILDSFERHDRERARRESGRRQTARDPFALPPPNRLTMPFGSLWHFFNDRREQQRLLDERRERQRRATFKQTSGDRS